MENPMATCGKCKATKVTVAHVRECYAVKAPAAKVLVPARDYDLEAALSATLAPADLPVECLAENTDGECPCPCDGDAEAHLANAEMAEFMAMVQDAMAPAKVEPVQTVLEAPELPVPAPKPAKLEIEDGMYIFEGKIYKVQHAVHGSGKQYAKLVTPGQAKGMKATFEYAPGVVSKLTPAMKMTLSEAVEFGAIYGSCCNCGRTLTDEKSIAKGIGPVCAKKFA